MIKMPIKKSQIKNGITLRSYNYKDFYNRIMDEKQTWERRQPRSWWKEYFALGPIVNIHLTEL